jgi:two-component SAPR family response regulator
MYEFGSFRVDAEERKLLKDGHPVPLTPKAFEVLLLLVESSGHVVETDELINRVWADSFVEEVNLKVTVSMLRKATSTGSTRHVRDEKKELHFGSLKCSRSCYASGGTGIYETEPAFVNVRSIRQFSRLSNTALKAIASRRSMILKRLDDIPKMH